MAYEVPPYISTRNIYQYTPSEYLPSIYGQYGKEFNFNRDSYDNWQLPYYQNDFLPLIPEQVDYNYDDYKYLHYVPNGGSEQHATVETEPYIPYFLQRETANWSNRIETTPQRSQASVDAFVNTGKELENAFDKKQGFSSNKAANIAKSGIGLATAIADDIGSAVRANRSQVTPLKFTYDTDGYNTFSDLNNFRKNELSYSTLEKPNKGAQTGDVFKRFGRGAASGASLGASIGGPWGAAVGAIAGAVGGLGSGIAKALTENSRYRKDISKTNKLNRLYNNQFNEATADILSNINIKNANTMNRQRLYNTFAEGGDMSAGDNFGVTQFNNGGSHEENPNNGIQQGIDANGQPNLVEEGEVRWNDFIFSNRIKPQQDVLSKFNSRMNKEFTSYADMANKILDMHKERENNPFDKSTLDIQMQRLAAAQEYQKLSEEAAQFGLSPEEYQMYQEQANQQMSYGGNLYAPGGWFYNPASQSFMQPSETNPKQDFWVPVDFESGYSGTNYNGKYLPYKYYEQFYKDIDRDALLKYYLSDAYQPTKDPNDQQYYKWQVMTRTDQAPTPDEFFTQATNDQWGAAHQALIDYIYNNYIKDVSVDTPIEKKQIEEKQVIKKQPKDVPYEPWEYNEPYEPEPYPWYAEVLRYAPVVNNLYDVLSQNNPDYTYARQIASLYQPETTRPVGQYQRYQPIDQYYTATNARNQGNTMYGFYKNNSNTGATANVYGTMAANLAKSAANNAYINAVNTNNQQRNAALAYNNQIDRANEQARHEAQRANIANYVTIMGNAYRAAEEERLAVDQARAANRQNLADNLALIGREQFDRWRINNDPSLSYKINWNYKNIIPMYTALINSGWTVDANGNWTAPKSNQKQQNNG